MHSFHFPFHAVQILWTLTFASLLVLLVVLIGRDRARRFPIFTASIVMVAFRLLCSQLLANRLPQVTMAQVFLTLADVSAVLSLLVVVEIARKAFAGVRRASWLLGALAVLAVGAVVLWKWGQWPALDTLRHGPTLQVMQFLAQKGMLLGDVATIVVGLLVVALGRRARGGFHTHVQKIAIGLMTASMSQLAIQAIWEHIAKTAAPHSMAEYTHIIGLRERLFNTNNAVYLAVLVWWIVWLWRDEPGTERRIETGEIGAGKIAAAEPEGTPHGRALPQGPQTPGVETPQA